MCAVRYLIITRVLRRPSQFRYLDPIWRAHPDLWIRFDAPILTFGSDLTRPSWPLDPIWRAHPDPSSGDRGSSYLCGSCVRLHRRIPADFGIGPWSESNPGSVHPGKDSDQLNYRTTLSTLSVLIAWKAMNRESYAWQSCHLNAQLTLNPKA
jgi:hypothetical protein